MKKIVAFILLISLVATMIVVSKANESGNYTIKISNKEKYVSNRTVTNDPNKDDITMILVIGQSNSTTVVGYPKELDAIANGHRSSVTEVTATPAANTVFMAKYGETISELNSSNDVANLISSDHIGGYSAAMGKRWNELTGEKVVIVQAAKGSRGMHEWVKDPENYTCTCGHSDALYSATISQFNACYNALKDNYNIKHSFYVWNQGEHDDKFSSQSGVTINSKEKYYQAYKSMHENLLADLPLDFGGINIARSHYGDNTKYLSTSRLGQYEATNKLPGCYLASRFFENTTTSDMDQTAEGSYGIHATQKTYNKWGKDAAEKIYDIAFDQNDGLKAVEILKNNSQTGAIKARFNADGDLLSGSNTLSSGETLAFVPQPSGDYTVSFSVDGDESKVDDFGTPNASVFSANPQLKINVTTDNGVVISDEQETTEPTSSNVGWHVMFDWENEGNHGDNVVSTTVSAGANKAVIVRELSAYNDGGYTLLSGSTKAIWIYNDLNNSDSTTCTPTNNKTPGTVTLNSLAGASDLRVNLHIKDKPANTEKFYIGVILSGNTYYAELTKSDYFSAKYYSFVGKTLTKMGTSENKTITAEDIPNITKIAGWVSTNKYSALLIDNIEYYDGTTSASGPTTVANTWNVMFDWENEANEDLAEITSTTADIGDIKRVVVKLLSVYDSAGAYTGRLLEGSTKAVMFYNDYNYTNGTTCSPLNNNVPGTIALNSLAGATDLRVNLHIKQTTKNDNFYIGVILNGDTYYTPIAKADYGTATYYSFVGKTLTKMGTEDTVTLTSSDIPNITALAGWVNSTDGWPAILVDNIEFFSGASTPTETSTEATEPTSASNTWNVLFDWENEGEDKSEITSTTVSAGANKAVTVKELSQYDTNYATFGFISGSTKAIWIYNDLNCATAATCNPTNGSAPATVAIPTLTGATDLRVNLHIKQKSYSPENMFIGVVMNGETYYKQLTKSDFFTASYYSFVGKTMTQLGSSSSVTITESDIPDITAIAGWVQTVGYSALLIDNIEYYGNEIEFNGGETPVTPTTKNIQYYRNNMKLDWSDEFDGDSLDTDSWNYQPESKHRNNQETAYKPGNVQIVDGNLVLTAKKETVTCGCDLSEEEHQAKYNHSKTYNYTAGGIDSQHKKLFKQGMIETRVNCPEGSGTWCSVWMCGVDSSGNAHWPFTGEIDIIEYAGKNPTQEFSSLHYTPTTYYEGISSYNKKSAGGNTYTLPAGKFSSGYHTIGIMWTETSIDFYIDDYVYQKVDITAQEFYAFRDYDFYFLVTFPLGGATAGAINDSILPQSFSVDYIRSYQPYEATAQSVTNNSITLQAREGYQYSKDGTNWQSSNVFTGLNADTEYTFYQRMAQTEVFSGATNKSKSVKIRTASNTDYSAIAGTTLDDAQMRIGSQNGIRFLTNIDTDLVETAKSEGYTVTMGTIIAPSNANDSLFTVDGALAKTVSSTYYNDDLGQIAGSLVGIKASNISRVFAARAYVTLTKGNYSVTYYSSKNEGRSLQTVAASAKSDSNFYNTLTSTQKAMVDAWAEGNAYTT